VLVATAVLNRELAIALLPYFALPFLAGVLMTVIGIYRTKSRAGKAGQAANPLQFWTALKMTVLFQIVLFGVYFAKARFGSAGVLTMGAVLGLTDMDALTISMAKSTASDAVAVGAQAIVIGIISNTVLKAAFALFLGSKAFWHWTLAGLAAIAGLLGAAMLVL
jgi:uncharacterized membrane protein (DUF4010 family)